MTSSDVVLSLDGVLASPLASGGLISGTVGLVDMSDLGNKGIVGVRVGQHGADGQ